MKIEKPEENNLAGETLTGWSKTVAHHASAEIPDGELASVQRGNDSETNDSGGFIYAERDLLCIEHLAELPTSHCIKCNQPAEKFVHLQLRSPLRPGSWWGKCPRQLTIGLSACEHAKHRFKTGLANTGLLFSLFSVPYGFIVNPWFLACGTGIFLLSSILKATSPVWYREVSKEFISIRGVSRDFLNQFDQLSQADGQSIAPTDQVGTGKY